MNSNLNNGTEHSYLCLVAIYAIHVVVFHVLSPPEVNVTHVTLPPQLGPMARWRTRSEPERPRNVSSLFTRAGARVEQPDNITSREIRESPGSPISGSVEATRGQFPHQVSIRRSNTGVHFCGGSILNEEWIVTAAHCMYSDSKLVPASTVNIYAGDLLLNETSSSSQSRRVRTIFVHQNFNMKTLRNDIALLKLRSKLILDNVTVAAKAIRNRTVADGTSCQVSGWGVTQYGTTVLSNELLVVDVPVINRSLCQRLMVNYSDIPQVMICAGYIEGGFDSCRGDSGGGLICDDVLTGLVSWGKECGLANFPGIYTNVYVFKDWIMETIATNASSPRGTKILSPAAWGVFFGCLVFLFTNNDHEKFDLEIA